MKAERLERTIAPVGAVARACRMGVAGAMLLAPLGLRAVAPVVTWTNAAGGLFTAPGNWNPSRVPGTNDNATFKLALAPKTVDWSGPMTNCHLTVSGGSVVFNLNSQTQTVTVTDSKEPGIYFNTGAKVVITNGVLIGTDTNKRHYWDNPGTRITVRDARIALYCSLYLRSTISSFDNCATLIVDGPGARVDAGGGLMLGSASGGYSHGWGSVIVTNGGYFSCTGIDNNSALGGCQWLTVAGSNSVLYVSNTLNVGNPQKVLRSVTGVVSVVDGGALRLAPGKGFYLCHIGSVSLDGGQLLAGTTASGSVSNGVVEGCGWVEVKQLVNGGTLRPGGAGRAGELTICGSLTNRYVGADGTVAIELGGRLPGQYDRLVVTNKLYAGGRLEVSLTDGFHPAGGDTFKILDFAAAPGRFVTISLPGEPAYWDMRSLYTTGEIRFKNPGTLILVQ